MGFAGWVERTDRASARPMTGSVKPIAAGLCDDGFRYVQPILRVCCARLLSSLRQLHEVRELQLAFRDLLRPDRDVLAVLPLEHQAGDVTGTRLDAVRELVVLAVELDVADRALELRLLYF